MKRNATGEGAWRRVLSRVLAAIALVALAWLLWRMRFEIAAILSQASPWHLARSVLWLVPVYLLNALGWRLVLRALGRDVDFRSCFWIWMFSSLGRYLPGGIWPYASRISMSMQTGVPAAEVTMSLYLETLLVAAASIVVGLPAIARMGLNTASLVISAVGVVALVIAAPLTVRVAQRLPGRTGAAFAGMVMPSNLALVGLSAFYVGFWLLVGCAFWDFSQALAPGLPLSVAVNGMALGFFAGFIVFLAPGGFGVREAVLYAVLVGHTSPSLALTLAVGSRVWFMAGELVSLVLAAILKRMSDTERISP